MRDIKGRRVTASDCSESLAVRGLNGSNHKKRPLAASGLDKRA